MNNKYIELNQFYKGKLIGGGSESKVFLTSDPDYVYKEFDEDLPKAILDSKMKNISTIMDMNEVSDLFIMVEHMVVDDKNKPDTLYGLIEKYDNSPSILTFDRKNMIIALDTLKLLIEKLKTNKIRYYDFHTDNIYHHGDSHKLKLGDIDSVCIMGIEAVYDGYFLIEKYMEIGGKPDLKAMTYIVNLLTYSLLARKVSPFRYNDAANYKETLISRGLGTNNIITFCDSMYKNKADQIADHEYLIDIVKDEIKVENNQYIIKSA